MAGTLPLLPIASALGQLARLDGGRLMAAGSRAKLRECASTPCGAKATGIGSGSVLGLAGHRAQGVGDGLPAELLGIPDGRRQGIPQLWLPRAASSPASC